MNLSDMIANERKFNEEHYQNYDNRSRKSMSMDKSDQSCTSDNQTPTNKNRSSSSKSHVSDNKGFKSREKRSQSKSSVTSKNKLSKSNKVRSESEEGKKNKSSKYRSRSSSKSYKHISKSREKSRTSDRKIRNASKYNESKLRNSSKDSKKRNRSSSHDRRRHRNTSGDSRKRRRDVSRDSRRKHRDRNSPYRSKNRDRRSVERSRRRKSSSENSRYRNEHSSRRRRSDSRSRYYAADVKEIQQKLTDEEKDARTVNVWQLSHRVRTRDLEDLFSTVGKLCVVRLILDPRSGKSRGVAYIQFRNTESVDKALGLTGTKLLGVPIMIRTVSSEKCRAAEASMGGGGINMKGPTKLCISNLHEIITEKHLEEIFSPYGTINEIKLLNDITGHSSGTAFITFQKGENAKMALDQLNEFVLAQKPIKITPVTESNFGSELNESQGVSMSASDRLGLMAKLAVGTSLQITPTVRTDERVVISTQCMVLSNMFDVTDAQDEEFCEEITDDIITECSKLGGVLHVHVDKKGPSGNVYIKCPTVPIASQIANSLNGRSFDGRIITVSYIPLTNYTDLFPESVKATKKLRCKENI